MAVFYNIDINNYVNITINTAPQGLSNYKINNLALFTTDTPLVSVSLGYLIYTNATDVGNDWGTTSETYLHAVQIFSQTPNILNANGNLIIIPLINSVATAGTFTTPNITLNTSNFSGITGGFKIAIDGGSYIEFNNFVFPSNPTLSQIKDEISTILGTATFGGFTTSDISANVSNFDNITDGSFKISVNGGIATEIDSISFGATPTLSDIATAINNALISNTILATATISGNKIIFESTIAGSLSTIALTSSTTGTDITGATYLNISTGINTTGHNAIAVTVSIVEGSIVFTSNSTGSLSQVLLQAPSTGIDLTQEIYLNVLNGVSVQGQNSGGIETLSQSIARTLKVIFYGAILTTFDFSSEMPTLAGYIQTLNKILFYSSNNVSDLYSGNFVTIKSSSYNHTKCLCHTIGTEQDARLFASAYASLLFSTNFDLSNSTQNMNLKNLVGINPSSWTSQDLNQSIIMGVDIYGTTEGLNIINSASNNGFIDSIFNLIACVGDLQVAYFNVLKTTSSKIPQTEAGMDSIKSALRKVLNKYVSNAYIAPGRWTRSDTFGDYESFIRNISDNGYYIYSLPVENQNQADRENRIAPTIQVALKEAGAINKGNVIVYVNR
jgi:hypothetical protein